MLVHIIVPVSLWYLAVKGNSSETDRLIVYFILYHGLIGNIQSSRVAKWIGRKIERGELNAILTKPISFPVMETIRIISLTFARLVIPLGGFAAASIIQPDLLLPASLIHFLAFAVFVIIGLLVWNMLGFAGLCRILGDGNRITDNSG